MPTRVLLSLLAATAMLGSLPLWWWLQHRSPHAAPAAQEPTGMPDMPGTATPDMPSESTPPATTTALVAPVPSPVDPGATPDEPVRPEKPQPELITGPDPGRSPLADRLNAPDGSVEQDLSIVRSVLANYLLEFGAHPVGANREITAQLSGTNPRRHAPLPGDVPAINAAGELTDRWGTPYFFHALSAREMEIRSAGPDRELYTDDDAVWSPVPGPRTDTPAGPAE